LKLHTTEKFRQKDIVIQQRLGGIDINEKMANFTFEIDVRGNRVEEALPRIDSFLDTAIMLNYNELRILHGKGDGILRQVIREHLRKYKQVRSMQDEHVERGGAGITVVQFKGKTFGSGDFNLLPKVFKLIYYSLHANQSKTK
jgi:DNA mismatch repair protein MutS2